jgi:hypothetical protein
MSNIEANKDSAPELGLVPGSAVNDDDRMNLWQMHQAVMGGGVASVNEDEAQRLEKLGLVKLGPADDADDVPGEAEPTYSFTLTKAGEDAAKAYRASWKNSRAVPMPTENQKPDNT